MGTGGRQLMLGFDGPRLDPAFIDTLHATGARSVILFARNIRSASQAHELIAEIRDLVPWRLLFAVDQEGGTVVRITSGATVFPGNMALGAANEPALAREQGRESGRQLAAIGFDMNLAPVVDLQTNPRNPGIGVRSLGAARPPAVRLARELIAGHAESGVASCLKHFPGKGAASVDAHFDLPILDTPLAEFREPHLRIFGDLFAGAERLAVMTTHLVVRGIDPELPATLSRRVVHGLLRQEMGFGGLVISDDLEMGAIVKHHGVAEACVLGAAAGHDLLPICHTRALQLDAAKALDRALGDGRLDPQQHGAAVARIERFAATASGGSLVDPTAGDRVAQQIAERSIHLFGDPAGLLPLDPATPLLVLAARPHAVVGVEEEADRDWARLLQASFRKAGLERIEVRLFEADLTDEEGAALIDAASAAPRVVLLSWNALATDGMRSLLDRACRTLAPRLVVVHLRNPFDQALLPEDVTSLTTFGYRNCQLEALAGVLSGRIPARGILPAPVQ